MKKQFLTLALLATVAVGGAFAGNSTAKLDLIPAGPQSADTACDVQDVPCTTNPGITCTIGGIDLYTNDNVTGKCTVPLSFQ